MGCRSFACPRGPFAAPIPVRTSETTSSEQRPPPSWCRPWLRCGLLEDVELSEPGFLAVFGRLVDLHACARLRSALAPFLDGANKDGRECGTDAPPCSVHVSSGVVPRMSAHYWMCEVLANPGTVRAMPRAAWTEQRSDMRIPAF